MFLPDSAGQNDGLLLLQVWPGLAQEVGAVDNFRLMRYDIVFRDKYHSKAEINRL